MKHDEVEQLRGTVTGSGLIDDAIESAHSREKAELQKALAARISEVENLAADVAHEREKNKTQAESIGQCLDEIDRLKRLVALRTQDLSIYRKALENAGLRTMPSTKPPSLSAIWLYNAHGHGFFLCFPLSLLS